MEIIKKTVTPVATAKPTTATNQTPVAANSAAKLAPLKPLAGPNLNLAGAHKEAAEPKPEAKPVTAAVPAVAPKVETKPAATAPQVATTEAAPKLAEKKPEHAEQKEKLGPKLRRKGDILKALRGGAHLAQTTEGLYRMVAADSIQKNPVSKRRVLAMIAQKLLTRTMENGESRYVLDRDAAKKATEKKAETRSEPAGPAIVGAKLN